MSEMQSALQGAVFDGAVRVEEAGLAGMVTLRGDFGDQKLRKAVRDVVGVDVPGTGAALFKDETGALWMAPDELLLLLSHAAAPEAVIALDGALAGTHFLAVNVSDARALFRLTGARVREVLARLTPADLRPDRLPHGKVRRTRLAQIPAAIWFTEDDTAHVVCFRSVAEYAFDLLSNAAANADALDFF